MDTHGIVLTRDNGGRLAYGEYVQFRVLGPVEVVDRGERIAPGGVKQRTVLAILLAHAGVAVSTERLIEATWGQEAPSGARRSLQTYVSNLRGLLGDCIARDGSGYRLDAERSAIDALWFEDEVLAARAMDEEPGLAADHLRTALAVWRGHPYDDVDDSAELLPEVARLENLRMVALEARIDADLASGHHGELLGELDALTSEYPLRERLRAQQMIALFRSGRQAEALRAYQKTRTHLGDELGIAPSPELQEMEQRVLDQDASLLLGPARSIVRKAVLVADIDLREGLDRLMPAERDQLVDSCGQVLDSAVVDAHGVVFGHRGSATYAAFDSAVEAVAAAEFTQRRLDSLDLRGPGLRMAIDIGDVESGIDDEITGPPVSLSAGLVAAAFGGQVLLSPATHAALGQSGDAGWQIKGLGSHHVEGVDEPIVVQQLIIPGVSDDFPELRVHGTPPGLPSVIRGLPGYELREVIGRGAFGVVHRAYQPTVGREVAIKVIRPDLANEPEFIRRFEVEAQFVARLEHPHVVPLYDYWRDPDGAYLVMRWVRGGSLASRLASRWLSLDEAAELVAQLAPALDYAHRAGVIHRDLKPSNVLFDEDGNAYLTDFGIASDAVARPAAPGPVHPGTDVVGLAELLQVCLGADVPEPVSLLLAAATSVGAGSRFATVVDFVAAWDSALTEHGLDGTTATFTPTRNPYKGLAAFDESDADDFFGRREVVSSLVATIAESRLVAVAGPSGIGKSSVVSAGVIPALRADAAQGSESWLITRMIPGPYPFEELASALLRIADRHLPGLDAELRRDRRGLVRSVERLLPLGSEALLVIDQFEEVFTDAAEPQAAQQFLDALTDLVTDAEGRMRVLLTVRADFLDRPLRHAEFGELLRAATVLVPAPTVDDLAEIVKRPAENLGVDYEPGLVERIVSDVSGQPAALPLLEFALTELFAGRTTNTITQAAYDAGGGVLGALAHRADDVYSGLDIATQQATRQVLLRLVNISAASEATRRRVRRTELDNLDVASKSVEASLTELGAARLLTFDRDLATRGPTVEVAHEAIFTQWERLRSWIEVHREDLILGRRVGAAVTDWEEAERDPSYLATGTRLVQFDAWAESTDLALTSAEVRYLRDSRAAEERRIATRRRRRRAITAGFAAMAIGAVAMAIVAWVQRGDAQREARLAQARELVGEADAVREFDPELSGLLALRAVEAFDAAGDGPIPGEAVSALRAAIAAQRVTFRVPGGRFVAVHPDGSLLATADGDDVAVWDIASREVVERYPSDGLSVRADFSADGNLLAVQYVDADFPVVVWNRATGQASEIGVEQPRDATQIAFSDDGDLLAFGSGRLIELWSVPDLQKVMDVDGFGFDFAADGAMSFGFCEETSTDCDVRIMDTGSGTIIGSFTSTVRPVFTAWSPDGSRLAVADVRTAVVHDATSGEEISRTNVERVHQPRWLPSGEAFLIGGTGVPRLIDAESGDVLLELAGQAGGADTLDLLPGAQQVASGGLGGDTVIYDLSELGGVELGGWIAPVATILHATYGRDGATVVIADLESVASGNALDGSGLVVARGEPSDWFPLPSRDGSLAPVADTTAEAGLQEWVVRDLDTNDIIYRAPPGWGIRGVDPSTRRAVIHQFDDCDTRLVSTDNDGLTPIDLESGCIGKVEFSANGEIVVTHNLDETTPPFTTAIFDTATGELLRSLDHHLLDGLAADFTPDSSRLLVGSLSGTVTVFDVALLLAGEPIEAAALIQIPAHDSIVPIVTASPDGSMAFSVSSNGPLKLWNLETGQLLSEFGGEMEGRGRDVGAFHPTLPQVMVASPPNLVRIHTLDVDELVDIARSRLTRDLTEEECQLYLREPCAG